MAFNISGFGTIAPNATVTVCFSWGGQDHGAVFAQAKPEGATIDGTQNRSLTSYNHNIALDVATQHITYSFQAQNTSPQFLSYMLCGGGLT